MLLLQVLLFNFLLVHLNLLIVGALHGLVDLCHLGNHVASGVLVLVHLLGHLIALISNLLYVRVGSIPSVLL